MQEKKRKKIGKEKENDGKKIEHLIFSFLRLSVTYLFSFSIIIEIKHGIHIHNQVQFYGNIDVWKILIGLKKMEKKLKADYNLQYS